MKNRESFETIRDTQNKGQVEHLLKSAEKLTGVIFVHRPRSLSLSLAREAEKSGADAVGLRFMRLARTQIQGLNKPKQEDV